MPRNRLLAQIEDELVHAHESLKFWRDQILLLSETEYQVGAELHVLQHEAEISRLLKAQEILHHFRRS